ncbi:hypothetical protein [Parolsenella catena]|uniref:hypothetical protein n=1 Tax=Parolsenella catena TaxID=2003188 RepID=UPI002FDEA9EB
MHRLSYISGTGAAEVCLDCRSALAGTAEGVRGREWGYSIGYRSIAAATRAARECSLSVTFLDLAVADELRRLADRDVSRATPGTLTIDGWAQRAYVTKAEPSSISRDHAAICLTVVLLDGVWRKGHTVSFEPLTATQGDGDSLDLPYDLPHDLGAPSARSYIDVGEWGAAPLKLTIYGPCTNPAVRIDGNWYRVDATVPDGGYLVVDPLAVPRSVTLVNADGSTVDAFPKAHRGDGLGSGEYIFQPASAGTHEVYWDKSFGFDLTWYEEEGEPPWS